MYFGSLTAGRLLISLHLPLRALFLHSFFLFVSFAVALFHVAPLAANPDVIQRTSKWVRASYFFCSIFIGIHSCTHPQEQVGYRFSHFLTFLLISAVPTASCFRASSRFLRNDWGVFFLQSAKVCRHQVSVSVLAFIFFPILDALGHPSRDALLYENSGSLTTRLIMHCHFADCRYFTYSLSAITRTPLKWVLLFIDALTP